MLVGSMATAGVIARLTGRQTLGVGGQRVPIYAIDQFVPG
jgi:hypothetical protein